MKSCRQASPRQDPFEQSGPIESGGLGNDCNSPVKSLRIGGSVIRIAEQVCGVEAAFTDQALWIDRQPAPRAEVEDIVVVDVTVQHRDIQWRRQKLIRRLRALSEYAAMDQRRGSKRAEPSVERNDI